MLHGNIVDIDGAAGCVTQNGKHMKMVSYSTTVTVLQRYAYSFRLTDSFMALGITVSCSVFLFSSTLLWVKAWSDQVNFTTGSDGHLFRMLGLVQRKMTTCTSLLMKNKKSLRLEQLH